jgi:hypothetical protein
MSHLEGPGVDSTAKYCERSFVGSSVRVKWVNSAEFHTGDYEEYCVVR